MNRAIRSFNTLTPELLDKLQELYPDGFDNDNIRSVTTVKGDTIKALELQTAETLYLIRMDPGVRAEIEEFLDNDDSEDDDDDRDWTEKEGIDDDVDIDESNNDEEE